MKPMRRKALCVLFAAVLVVAAPVRDTRAQFDDAAIESATEDGESPQVSDDSTPTKE